jgi:hypothetical protein
MLAHLRLQQDRKLRLHLFRRAPKDLRVELQVGNAEGRAELVHIDQSCGGW